MGSWGYGPLDNDGAADLRDNLYEHIYKVVRKNLTSEFPDERRAAAFFLIRFCSLPDFNSFVSSYDEEQGLPILNKARDVLLGLLADTEWLQNWKQSDVATEYLKQELASIMALSF